MKTSNYITTSFFVFLFGGVFILFLTAKVDSRSNNNTRFETLEQPLDSFSVVVAQSGANINLTKGPASKIMKHYQKGDTCTLPTFIVRNDTLFVQANSTNEKQPTAQIIYKQINGIVGKEQSQINLDQFTADTFNIAIQAGKLFCFPNVSIDIKKNLNIHACNGAYVRINQVNIRDLNLHLDGSELNMQNTPIDKLSGSMENGSKFYSYKTIRKLNLEVDSTSTYQLN